MKNQQSRLSLRLVAFGVMFLLAWVAFIGLSTNGNTLAAGGTPEPTPAPTFVPAGTTPIPTAATRRGPGPNGERRLIVKFADNAGFSTAGNTIVPPPGFNASALNATLSGIPGAKVGPLITTVAPAAVAAIGKAAADQSGRQLADMTQYFAIDFPLGVSDATVQAALASVLAAPGVAFAYEAAAPVPPPTVDIPPTTPLMTSEQFYLQNAASGGFDVAFAWTQPGGKGDPVGAIPPVRLIDIEYDWNEHEDLPSGAYTLIGGEEYTFFSSDHGNAAIGISAGLDNAYGITGIAHLADVRPHGAFMAGNYNLADAILNAVAVSKPGDVFLIEQQWGPVSAVPPCPSGCSCGTRYMPVEADRAIFDAIAIATVSNRVVVMAAGNGYNDLDWFTPANGVNIAGFPLGNPFDRNIYNSGAIYVGAGQSINYGANQRAPHCYSNFGSRLDVQGIGDNIVTLGYGNRFNGNTGSGPDVRQLYTSGFSGTSSSSALIAGVATLVQSYAQTKGVTLTAAQILAALKEGALPQNGTRLIGPRPDLSNALPAIRPDTIGVYRPSSRVFHLRDFNTSGWPNLSLNFGLAGDIPVVGDWNGDKVSTIGVWRPSARIFYLKNVNSNAAPIAISVNYGLSTDIPVVGDWDGNGTDTIGVWRPSSRRFLLRDSNTSGAPDRVITFGLPGDIPIVGDWDGDGTDTPGVFRPSAGRFYLTNTTCLSCAASIHYTVGTAFSTDLPVVGDWNWDGKDGVGVFRPSSGVMYLWNTLAITPFERSLTYGLAGDQPVAGAWK